MLRSKKIYRQRKSFCFSKNDSYSKGNMFEQGDNIQCDIKNTNQNQKVAQKQKFGAFLQLNQNLNLNIPQATQKSFSKKPLLLVRQGQRSKGRYDQHQKQNLYAKIGRLIKEQEGVVICHSNRYRNLSQSSRPMTSHSMNYDSSKINKCNMILVFEEDKKDIQKTSTSRALMNKSQVYKNDSIQRCRLKKRQRILSRGVSVSAKGIVLQNKVKKQEPIKEHKIKYFSKRKQIRPPKIYQEEQFELAGWEFSDF